MSPLPDALAQLLAAGTVIPAHPLALTAGLKLDERRQAALTRYYCAAGAGGVAVGVHSTQFEIREPQHALLRPVLELAAQVADDMLAGSPRPFIKIAGICGATPQALAEAELAHSLGYHAGLVSLGALPQATDAQLLAHCRQVAGVLPVIGFYLQPAVGGRLLSYAFWRELADIPNVVAIKIAPFNRYQTLDVARAVAASGRLDLTLLTGNDDNILPDLLTEFAFGVDSPTVRIVGGLLGQWAVWTRAAVQMLAQLKAQRASGLLDYANWLTYGVHLTDANSVIFDAANQYRGALPGIHEVLRRQGLLAGTWCLNEHEVLSPGQAAELDRIAQVYPHLTDDAFVAEHLDEWLR